MDRYFIGVDPGKTGALAIIDESLQKVEIVDYPGSIVSLYKLLDKLFDEWDIHISLVHAYIEKVGTMPKQGIVSAFTFGENYGAWQYAMASAEIPYEFVTPRKWQKAMFDSKKEKDTKKQSLDLARRLFPKVDLHLEKHDGRADALHLARYARMKFLEGK